MSNLTLENVENKIAAIIEDPQGNYNVGGTNFTWSQYYEFLRKLREDLRNDLIATQDADVSIMAFDVDVNEFGEDNSQVES